MGGDFRVRISTGRDEQIQALFCRGRESNDLWNLPLIFCYSPPIIVLTDIRQV